MPIVATEKAIKAVKRRDPVARLGLAICLVGFFLFCLGWWLWWNATNASRVHLTLYFRNTVHGIDVGSPVKILGVSVGQVESMGVRLPTRKDPDHYAAVNVVLDGNLLASKGLPRELDHPGPLKTEIARGLRGRMQLISPITGDMYLELGYIPDSPAGFVAASYEHVAEVPTLPDPLSEGLLNATHRFAELEKRDFDGLQRELFERLDRIAVAADPAAVRDMNAAAIAKLDELRTVVSNPEIRKGLSTVNADLRDFRAALAKIDVKTGDGTDEARATAAKLREDLAQVSSETDKIGRALDPRSPSLLLAYMRIASVRDDAGKVRGLCEQIMNANDLLADLFLRAGSDEAPPVEK